MWMDLESVIQSAVSQKDKISYTNTYIQNLEKWHRARIETQTQKTEGEGGMNWGSRSDTRVNWIAAV